MSTDTDHVDAWTFERSLFTFLACGCLVAFLIGAMPKAFTGSLRLSLAHARADTALTKKDAVAHGLIHLLWMATWHFVGLAMCDQSELSPFRWQLVVSALLVPIPWAAMMWLSSWLYGRMESKVDQWTAANGAFLCRAELWIRRAGWVALYLLLTVSFGHAASVLVWWAVRGSTDLDVAWSVAGAWAFCAFSLDYVLLCIGFKFVGPTARVRAVVSSLVCTCGLLVAYCNVLAHEVHDEGSEVTVHAMHWACVADIFLVAFGLAASAFWPQPAAAAAAEATPQCSCSLVVRTLGWLVYVGLQIAGVVLVVEYQRGLTTESVHSHGKAMMRMWTDLLLAAAGTASLCVHALEQPIEQRSATRTEGGVKSQSPPTRVRASRVATEPEEKKGAPSAGGPVSSSSSKLQASRDNYGSQVDTSERDSSSKRAPSPSCSSMNRES